MARASLHATAMRLTDTLRTFASSASVAPLPPRSQVWDCCNETQALVAAFEVNEVALHAGFMPDEATTLSLTLAELARGGVASVFFGDSGWRLEVCGFKAGSMNLRSVASDALKLRVHKRSSGDVVIAEYERPSMQ